MAPAVGMSAFSERQMHFQNRESRFTGQTDQGERRANKTEAEEVEDDVLTECSWGEDRQEVIHARAFKVHDMTQVCHPEFFWWAEH